MRHAIQQKRTNRTKLQCGPDLHSINAQAHSTNLLTSQLGLLPCECRSPTLPARNHARGPRFSYSCNNITVSLQSCARKLWLKLQKVMPCFLEPLSTTAFVARSPSSHTRCRLGWDEGCSTGQFGGIGKSFAPWTNLAISGKSCSPLSGCNSCKCRQVMECLASP